MAKPKLTLDGCTLFWDNPDYPLMPGVGIELSRPYHAYLVEQGTKRQSNNKDDNRYTPAGASYTTHQRGACSEGGWKAIRKMLHRPEIELAVAVVYRFAAADVGRHEVKSNRSEYRDLGMRASLLLFRFQLTKKPNKLPRGFIPVMLRPHVCAFPMDDQARRIWYPGWYVPKWGLDVSWRGTWGAKNAQVFRVPLSHLAMFPVEDDRDARASSRRSA